MGLNVLHMQEKVKATANIPLIPKIKKTGPLKINQEKKSKKEIEASELNMDLWLCELTWKENRRLLVYNKH